MPSPSAYLVFVATALTLLLIPGPAVMYVVGQTIGGGRRAGVASVLGIHTGTLVHVTAAAVGISSLLVASATAFSIVKYAGAAYLIVLGIRRLFGKDAAGRGGARGPRACAGATGFRGSSAGSRGPCSSVSVSRPQRRARDALLDLHPKPQLRCGQVVRRRRRASRQWSLRTDRQSWALFLWSDAGRSGMAAEETKHYLANGHATAPDAREALEWARETTAKMVDLKFCDLLGTWQHVTLPIAAFDESAFDEGLGFDGSSIRGWQGISESDMLLMPDASSAILDPFCEAPTLSLICEIADPLTRQGYAKDPRRIAKRAEKYLLSTN